MKKGEKKELARLIERGVEAARAGYKEEAEELLSQAVAIDPENERAWLWLSAVVEGIEAQRECLNRVLEINPTNSFARAGLSFLNHLQVGYEYMAARAPWMAGVEEQERGVQLNIPDQRCPQCGAINPGWAYLCSRCSAILEPVDITKIMRQEIRRRQRSLLRPWAGAAVLDAERAFAPEVELASPLRALLSILLGALALNLLRTIGFMGLATLAAARWPKGLTDRLAAAFLADQVWLLLGGLAVWLLLSVLTYRLARSRGGQGSPRVHYYLTAVAVSAWMSIAGIVDVLWWAGAMLGPASLTPLVASIAWGVLFFYGVTLLVQAIHTTHRLEPLRETLATGLLLTLGTVAYVGILALLPSPLRAPALGFAWLVLLPPWP